MLNPGTLRKAGGRRIFARFRRDRRGVSALEFALIAPILILVYFGMAELSEAMMAQRRVSHATSAMGDLVAQHDNAQMPMHLNTDVPNVLAAATDILAPFPTAPLNLRMTSVVVQSDGSTKVDWSAAQGTALPQYAQGTSITVPSGLISTTQGDSVIMVESSYHYTSPIGYVLPGGLNFGETFYLKPRKTPYVALVNP